MVEVRFLLTFGMSLQISTQECQEDTGDSGLARLRDILTQYRHTLLHTKIHIALCIHRLLYKCVLPSLINELVWEQ